MKNLTNSLAPSLLAISLLALFTFEPPAAARNIFKDFSKAPTFTPPPGCIPKEQTYGVLSRCEKTVEPGHIFIAMVDTAMGSFGSPEDFADDQIEEIRAYWKEEYQDSRVDFSSKISNILPANVPARGIECREYSIAAETRDATDQQPASRAQRVEGLTCAWRVDNPVAGQANIEIFWLEAYDEYAPSLGQEPMQSFDQIVKALFASARL